MTEIEHARSALNFLNPSCSRSEWILSGMAAKSAGLDFEDFHKWSMNGENYKDEKDCLIAWNSFDEFGGITAGTLFHKARENGWKDQRESHVNANANSSKNNHKNIKASQETTNDVTNTRALDIWEKCQPVTATHPYIMRKNGRTNGLRYYPETATPLLIKTKEGNINVAKFLAIPSWSDDKLQTLQFVSHEGKKLNLDNATFGDGYFVVGDIDKTALIIYITESISNAWSIYQAINVAVVVLFGSSRMPRIAKVLRVKYPSARLIIAPDRGMEKKAVEIASEIGCQWIELPQDKPSNYDVNDYAIEHGYESLANLLANVKSPELRYKMLSVDDLYAAPPMEWIVKGIIPKVGLAALYGSSGSGKSFLLLDLALAIATSETFWFGRRISTVPITYVCLEGESGLGKRVKAWFTYANKVLSKSIRFITQPFNLLTEDVGELVKAIFLAGHTNGMIILDTLNRAAPGADENSPIDMGKIIAASSQLQRLTNGMVLLAHHTGKDETKKMRGHTSLPAALDGAIEVTKAGTGRQWAVAKSKDDKDGDTYSFQLEVINLSVDKDGDAITSCIVLPCDKRVASINRTRKPRGDSQRIVLEALNELFNKSTFLGKGDAPAAKPCVEYDTALEKAMNLLPCDKKRRKERTEKAISGLVANGFLAHRGGWLWIP